MLVSGFEKNAFEQQALKTLPKINVEHSIDDWIERWVYVAETRQIAEQALCHLKEIEWLQWIDNKKGQPAEDERAHDKD